MGAPRRLTTAAVGLLALATVGGAAFSFVALSTSTDAAFRERSHVSTSTARPSSTPTVAGTEASRPASSTAPRFTVTPKPSPEPVLEPGDHGVRVRELQSRVAPPPPFPPPPKGRPGNTPPRGVG
ncbi:hypothetical protein BH10ACT10_BH10ACT10_07480 [soil metagenome]